jgi:hypothetical protein
MEMYGQGKLKDTEKSLSHCHFATSSQYEVARYNLNLHIPVTCLLGSGTDGVAE